MSTARFRKQGGYKQARNIGTSSINSDGGVSIRSHISFHDLQNTPGATANMDPGTLIWNNNKMEYKTDDGEWHSLATGAGSVITWQESVAPAPAGIYYDGKVGIGDSSAIATTQSNPPSLYVNGEIWSAPLEATGNNQGYNLISPEDAPDNEIGWWKRDTYGAGDHTSYFQIFTIPTTTTTITLFSNMRMDDPDPFWGTPHDTYGDQKVTRYESVAGNGTLPANVNPPDNGLVIGNNTAITSAQEDEWYIIDDGNAGNGGDIVHLTSYSGYKTSGMIFRVTQSNTGFVGAFQNSEPPNNFGGAMLGGPGNGDGILFYTSFSIDNKLTFLNEGSLNVTPDPNNAPTIVEITREDGSTFSLNKLDVTNWEIFGHANDGQGGMFLFEEYPDRYITILNQNGNGSGNVANGSNQTNSNWENVTKIIITVRGLKAGFKNMEFSFPNSGATSQTSNIKLSGREDCYINPTQGNVGIGRTDPSYKLDVDGQVRTTDGFIGTLLENPSGNLAINTIGGAINFQTQSSTGNPTMVIDQDDRVAIRCGNPKNTLDIGGGVAIGTNYAGASNTSVPFAPAQGLIVEGKVGIGTNDPTHRLVVGMTGDAVNEGVLNIQNSKNPSLRLTSETNDFWQIQNNNASATNRFEIEYNGAPKFVLDSGDRTWTSLQITGPDLDPNSGGGTTGKINFAKITSSSDGSKLVAMCKGIVSGPQPNPGQNLGIYYSLDSGATWNQGSSQFGYIEFNGLMNWTTGAAAAGTPHGGRGIASSSDGTKVVAATYGNQSTGNPQTDKGDVFYSDDSGQNWYAIHGPTVNPQGLVTAVAISDDGGNPGGGVIVICLGKYILATNDAVAANSNPTWNIIASGKHGTPPNLIDNNFTCIDISADGTRIVASDKGGNARLYIADLNINGSTITQQQVAGIQASNEYPSAWDASDATNPSNREYSLQPAGVGQTQKWETVAISADKNVIVIGDTVNTFKGVYISSDGGINWSQAISESGPWNDMALSSDGSRITVVGGSSGVVGTVYESSDTGVTWTQSQTLEPTLYGVACNGDGTNVTIVSSNGNTISNQNGYINLSSPNPLLLVDGEAEMTSITLQGSNSITTDWPGVIGNGGTGSITYNGSCGKIKVTSTNPNTGANFPSAGGVSSLLTIVNNKVTSTSLVFVQYVSANVMMSRIKVWLGNVTNGQFQIMLVNDTTSDFQSPSSLTGPYEAIQFLVINPSGN